MAKNLLIITQKVNETDDLLGFFVSWIAEFAKHFTRVDVIALGAGTYKLPANVHVHSLGKETGAAKLLQAIRMEKLLWKYTPECGAVFAHMSPIFAILAWPFAALRRSKLTLWYLHRSWTLKLRLALVMVDVLVTADADSLTVRSRKIIAVGHGIDTARFAVPVRTPPSGRPLRMLSVGRLSPIKGYETLIRAASQLRDSDVACEVRIVGRAVMRGDHAYEEELHALVSRLGVGDIVHFFGFVPYRDMPAQYAWADIVVGCTPPGGIDKALLEGMAAGCAIATSNTVMRKYIASEYADDCIFRHDDSSDLADTLERLSSTELSSVGSAMQRAVVQDHNLPVAIGKIAALI